jgi:prepilin-type N-terminal cleavage/methylation domain-containing protein
MSEDGMTLIEVLVTVLIITMLASVATLSVHFYLNEGKTRIATGDLNTLKAAVRLYILDKGNAPTLPQLVPDYLPELPKDPFVTASTDFLLATDATTIYIYSVGPNGVDDTYSGDDIVVTVNKP